MNSFKNSELISNHFLDGSRDGIRLINCRTTTTTCVMYHHNFSVKLFSINCKDTSVNIHLRQFIRNIIVLAKLPGVHQQLLHSVDLN